MCHSQCYLITGRQTEHWLLFYKHEAKVVINMQHPTGNWLFFSANAMPLSLMNQFCAHNHRSQESSVAACALKNSNRLWHLVEAQLQCVPKMQLSSQWPFWPLLFSSVLKSLELRARITFDLFVGVCLLSRIIVTFFSLVTCKSNQSDCPVSKFIIIFCPSFCISCRRS